MHRLKSGGFRNLVQQSAKLNFPGCAICFASEATDLRTLWYAIMLYFFCRVDCGIVAFVTTFFLSQKQLVGPIIGIPMIQRLYHNASFISVAIFNVTNSLPKILDSIVFCLLEYQLMGAPLIKTRIPVVERLVM
jgi:hypothetical protein